MTSKSEKVTDAKKRTVLIVVRNNMIGECYGADLLKKYGSSELVEYDIHYTQQITTPDDMMLKHEYEYLLIVGGYYGASYDKLKDKKHIQVFTNSKSDIVDTKKYTNIENIHVDPKLYTGFVTWVTEKLEITDSKIIKFAAYFDAYSYGFPKNDILCFVNGVYVQEGKSLTEKISNAYDKKSVDELIKEGVSKRELNLEVAKARFSYSKIIKLTYREKELKVRYTHGDSPIVDSTLYLLNQNIYNFDGDSDVDMAIMLRYMPSINKTGISIRAKKGYDSSDIAKELWGGGGCEVAAGATKDGVLFY